MHLLVQLFLLSLILLMAVAQQTTTTTTTTTTAPSTTTTTLSSSTSTTTASTTTTTLPSTTTITGSSTTTTTAPSTTTTTGGSTTTTTRPSTTTNNDIAATAAQLWDVNFYYNWFFGTHAFCADTSCTDAIKANGIGYDMNFGKGVVGKAVSEASIAAVRTACPIGSTNLRNLGFEKSGNHYVHNLNGVGLKQGWVSTVNGACGAKVPIKRWKSRFTDDMMYTVNLDWNMWYQGMVQDAGQVLFYMWE